MRLSAPIYALKRKARLLSRQETIPLHEALDRVAASETISSWSLLVAKAAAMAPASKLFPRLKAGDLVLVGARPGQGKTLISLELAVEAMKAGQCGAFFTLEYTEHDLLDRFRTLGVEIEEFGSRLAVDCSDAISAEHIIKTLAVAPPGTLAVVDYLQLLDQRRENPDLTLQVRALKAFARERGLIFVFVSQIDRSYDPSKKSFPDIKDIRLPNPLDLRLFDKALFLNNGAVQFQVLN